MRKVSEMYKMYRELPIFQALFDALEELCEEENCSGEGSTCGTSLYLPLHMAPVVVHMFDRVMMERFQSSSTEFSFKGKLQTYKILQEHSWFVLSNAVITRGTCQKFRKSNEVARCKKLLVRCYNPFAEAAYEPSEVRTNCPYTLEVVEKEKKRKKKAAPSTGAGRGRPKKKQAKREGEFDPTMFATVIVNKDKVVKEDLKADWRRPLPYNEKLRRAKTEEERQALAVAQVGVKEALKGRFRKNVVEYPHRCVEAPRPRPIIDLASVKGSTLISEERNYAVVMGSLEQSLATWACSAGGTLALAPHNIHVAQGGKEEGRDSYTTRRKDNIGHLTINMTKVEAGQGSSSSLDVSLESYEADSPIQESNRQRSLSLSPRRSSPRALSPSSSPLPPPTKPHGGLKAQKLDHKPHNSLGAFKIPKKVSNASGIEVASAPLDDEVMKSSHEVMKSMVEVIKLDSSSCEEEEECNKTNRTSSINEGDNQEPTSDMVECLLDDSKEEEAEEVLSKHKEEELQGVESKAKEEDEELVDDLLEESIEENAKEEDEFGFLDDLMMDLKENPTEAAQVEDIQQEEELQDDDLLANL